MKQPDLPAFLLGDGAMGTELLRRGVLPGSCLEARNVIQPDLVASVHRDYRAAGAGLLTTNTFGANRFRLQVHQQEDAVTAINAAGVRLATEQASGALVAGSIGPTGIHTSDMDQETARAAFREQAEALHKSGVDLFSLETFGDVAELRIAVDAVLSVSNRPVIAHMTFMANGLTPVAQTASQMVDTLADLAITAIGVNCAVGADTVEGVVSTLRAHSSLPISVRPNAGQPKTVQGRLEYPVNPSGFSKLVRRLAPHVAIVGGCCGTTPRHIQAARLALC